MVNYLNAKCDLQKKVGKVTDFDNICHTCFHSFTADSYKIKAFRLEFLWHFDLTICICISVNFLIEAVTDQFIC